MISKSFCEYCLDDEYYVVDEYTKDAKLMNETISYTAKRALCSKCGNEIYVKELNNENLSNLYNEYRKKHEIITISEIKHIMVKYNINSESLSLLMKLDENAVSRYLNGDMISIEQSDILKKINDNPMYFSLLLQTNSKLISPIQYNKSRKALKKLKAFEASEENLDKILRYILIRLGDISKNSINILLYYMQSFYFAYTDEYLFEEDFIAEENGPVLKSVNTRYNIYGFESTNADLIKDENLVLEENEKIYAESIIKFFGCYSGKVLSEMAKSEAPWILTRKNIASLNNKMKHKNKIYKDVDIESVEKISKKLIATYFKGLREKYKMVNEDDIEKYALEIFEKISL